MPEIRGDIARIYFYMYDRYKLEMSKSQRKLMETWSKEDPVSDDERARNARIKAVQGNGNPFVE